MNETHYIFGPVPSRRLGRSLGVSPIPEKTCNYSCIYCQLGRTNHFTNQRQEFFRLEDILEEFDRCRPSEDKYDVVTIVGEGEPTLYSRLGELIAALKKRTQKPVAVITNGGLLDDADVRAALMAADIVLPSMDGYDEASYRKIDRHLNCISYQKVYEGLVSFSQAYQGKLYLEIMLMDHLNDDKASLLQYKEALTRINYDKLYLNTPIRPPAESSVGISSPAALHMAEELLGGIAIDAMADGSFYSEITDDYEAVISIIGRHPMNQHEIASFLESRNNPNPADLMAKLKNDPNVTHADYKGLISYRLKLKKN